MTVSPRVSIVMPLFDDEDYVASALDSCLAQTLADIEIIAVDDASNDNTAGIVEDYQRRDSRVRLIRQPSNLSAFQARRVGIDAATAPYILFLDGDDELAPNAAQTAVATAERSGADVVGFGVEIITTTTGKPTRLEAALQPSHDVITGSEIIPTLFPAGELPNGHLWRYLFATPLLRAAYDGIAADLTYYRANDLPVTFLALSQASRYVSTPERLYRYYFRRGTSGHAIDGVEHFRFLLSGVEPITAIGPRVHEVAVQLSDGDSLRASYESARLHVIGMVLRYCMRDTSGELQSTCLAMLKDEVGVLDAIRAAATACPDALAALSAHTDEPDQPTQPASRVLLKTRRLDTGGLQAVLLEQAGMLTAEGFDVTIAVMEEAGRAVDVPDGVTVVQIDQGSRISQLDHWTMILRQHRIDMIIDHHILYNENWPWFALTALADGIPTIGWVHSFALRPLYDNSQRASFLALHSRILLRLVTLSPTDSAFWKLQGIERAVYLPNPLSSLALRALQIGTPRTISGSTLELAWWGRLDRTTKQVLHLIDVAERLSARGIDFRLTIIGPDSRQLNAKEVRQYAQQRGVDDRVDLLTEQMTEQLLPTLQGADLLVSTSAIEGFQLTIVEAQALGMPVIMYDLPWLTTVKGNNGLVVTPQGDPAALAEAIGEVAADPARYAGLSRAAREFALATAEVDTSALTVDLILGRLSKDYSPAPTLDDSRILVEWLVRISERNIRESNSKSSSNEIAVLRRERDRAQSKLRHVMEGPSFRVGRALTALPRKARDLVRPQKSPGKAFPSPKAPLAAPAPPPPLRAPSDAPVPSRSVHPDVTFVIPVYNSAAWLDDCLSSVLAQTGVDVEVICINDGSTDDSLEILNRFAASDPRVSVIEQTNSGQSVGRNRGLDAAAGRYLIYLDSDDYWPHDALAALVQRADVEELDVLLFDCAAFLDGDVDEKTWRWYATYYQRAHTYRQVRSGLDLMVDMRRSKEYRPHVGLYMARTEYVRQLGLRFIPSIVHQDNPYTFRLMLNASRAAHERVDAYARRIRPGSTITTLTSERSARGYFLSYLEMMRELSSIELASEDAGIVGNIVDSVYEGAAKQFMLLSATAAQSIFNLDSSDDAKLVAHSLKERNRAHG